jgi:hypothetical protein
MVKLRLNDRRLATLLLVSSMALFSGCFHRRYTVRSDPPGALVIANGESLGPTPASREFEYYGKREFTLMLDGYQTKTVIQPIDAPWWNNYLTEFFIENLLPFDLRDDREFKYQLTTAQSPREDVLRDRAENMRSEARILPKPRRGGILAWLGFP